MTKVSILVDNSTKEKVFAEKYYERMAKSCDLAIYDAENFEDMNAIIDCIKGSKVLISSWGTPALSQEILDACPELELVIHAAGSVQPILTDEFLAKKIKVTNSACALGEGVAETALGFAISACKRFYWLNEDTANGLWGGPNRKGLVDFYDIKVGVISAGFVGRHMIKLLQNFHVDVLLYDPMITKEQAAALGAQKVELDELVSQSDVISIHAPSIPATDNMINKDRIKLIKDGAILINTARGAIIDEPALIEELKTGRFYACLDVTSPEPPAPENELRTLKNVVLTPHVAGAVTNGMKRIALHVCEELERYINGEELKTDVNLSNTNQLARG